MTDTNQKLYEALQHAIEDLSSATGFLTRRSRDRQSKTVAALAKLQADIIALPTVPAHADTWGISRAMVTLYAYECDGLTGDALALPTAAPEMPLSMNQFGRLVELTREHLTDNTFVYKVTSKTGDTCHFGVESAAKAWAKGGTVEAIKVREFKLHTGVPTADHLPDAGKMLNGLTEAETDASASVSGLTAAPVGEREAFEREMSKPPFEFCMDRWPDDGAYAWPGGYAAYHTQCAWDAWQARAALSAGDAVLADREACAKLCEEVADDLITAMRKEGETDDEVMTSLVASARVCAEEIRGGYSKKFNPHNAAIDAAMRKDKP